MHKRKDNALLFFFGLLTLALLTGCGSSSSNNTIPSTVTAFDAHNAIFTNSSTLNTAGYNAFGQLGYDLGNLDDQPTFRPVAGHFQGASTGGVHTLAFGNVSTQTGPKTGVVFAWGSNFHGQLGNFGVPMTGTGAASRVPVPVVFANTSSLYGVTAVAAGGFHSLALKGDGTVYSWGYNGFGQLGDRTNADRNVAVPVLDDPLVSNQPLGGISQIAAGGAHSLALTSSNGAVYAWGRNDRGALGRDPGTTGLFVFSPQLVQFLGSTLLNVTQIAAGGGYSLALQDTNDQDANGKPGLQRLYFWGNNIWSPTILNANLPKALTLPTAVTADNRIEEIAAGLDHFLIRLSDGSVWASGFNAEGQLGNQDVNLASSSPLGSGLVNFVQVKNVPGQVGDFMTATEIRAFGNSSMAKVNGAWWGWGDDSHGQLGVALSNTSIGYFLVPVLMGGL